MRVPNSIKNVLVSIVVLLVAFAGGGAVYVWYTGQVGPEDPAATATPVSTKPVTSIAAPPPPAPNAPVGASVQTLSSPVAPGQNTSMVVRTLPTAVCKIAVTYNGAPTVDSGLVAKTADTYGMVNWTWTVPAGTPEGTHPALVTCEYNKRSAVVRGDLVVSKKAAAVEQ